MNLEHRRGIVCVVHRLAKDICRCKLDQMNDDHKETVIVDWRERLKISKLYMDRSVKLRLYQMTKRSVKIGRGVRKRCLL